MNLSEPIDLYCERTDPSLWSEPVNAISNAAFLVAAVAALLIWQKSEQRDRATLMLIGVTFIIGFGSFAFHTLATRGAMLLDVVPIGIFIYGYLALALRRYIGLPVLATIAVLAGFIALTQVLAASVPRDVLNGSVGYLPSLAAMPVIAMAVPRGPTRHGLLLAAGTFAISLAFRVADHAACAAFPAGTHFAWHLCNAVVLYVLLRTAIAHGPRATALSSR